ncbi:hypothetical protein ACFVVA_37080 [Kitasatospora sp. NPDC058048]|uniref:hypothetical protein n=1 Tax=Kitasatospora sp. NPDC058048 TaxID=3346313 RepID=UPI0036DF2CF9
MSIRTEHVLNGLAFPPDPHGEGLHAVTTPFTEISTRTGPLESDVRHGAHVWLFDGAHRLGGVVLVCRRVNCAEVQQDAVREVEPWVPSIAHLARRQRLALTEWELRSLLDHPDKVPARDDFGDWATRSDAAAWRRAVLAFATEQDPVPPTDPAAWFPGAAERLGHAVLTRLAGEQAAALAAAADALPSAGAPLPPLTDRWKPWPAVMDHGSSTWVDEIAPLLFERWKAAPEPADRDRLIAWGLDAGIGKLDLHRATGIARSTIDRVLSKL